MENNSPTMPDFSYLLSDLEEPKVPVVAASAPAVPEIPAPVVVAQAPEVDTEDEVKIIPNEEFFKDIAINDKETTEDVAAITRHFEIMKSQGHLMLPDDYEFKGDIEDAYAQDQIMRNQSAINYVLSGLPDKARQVLSFALEGGQDIDAMMDLAKEEDWSKVQLTEDNSVKILSKFMSDKGIDEEDIENLIEGYKDDDSLLSKAAKAQEKLTADSIARKTKLIEEAKQRKAEEDQAIHAQSTAILDVLKGNAWDDSVKIDTYKSIFTADPNTNKTPLNTKLEKIYSDPNALVMLAALANGYDEKTKKWDFKIIEGAALEAAGKETRGAIKDFFKGGKLRTGNATTPDPDAEFFERFGLTPKK